MGLTLATTANWQSHQKWKFLSIL